MRRCHRRLTSVVLPCPRSAQTQRNSRPLRAVRLTSPASSRLRPQACLATQHLVLGGEQLRGTRALSDGCPRVPLSPNRSPASQCDRTLGVPPSPGSWSGSRSVPQHLAVRLSRRCSTPHHGGGAPDNCRSCLSAAQFQPRLADRPSTEMAECHSPLPER